MPIYSITLRNAAVAKRQALVDRLNTQQGTSLTVKQWILQTLKDAAIQEDLMAAIPALMEQANEDEQVALRQAIEAERQNLLSQL